MEITQAKKDQYTVLGLIGRLDIRSSKSLQEYVGKLFSENNTNLIVDFSQLDFISSSGLRAMLFVAKEVKARRGKLALVAMKSKVKDVFDLAGFTQLFSIYPSIDNL